MVTMIIPHQTLQHSMYLEFRNFDILGIVRLLKGGGIQIGDWNIMNLGEGVANFFASLNVLPDGIEVGVDSYGEPIMMQFKHSGMNIANSYLPLILMSATGLAFKNGLYIFMLRQFFRGIPDELEESAYMDGCGTFRTFIQIILPLSIPMMITVFLFAFCWQWTDSFYTNMFFTNPNKAPEVLSQFIEIPKSLDTQYAGQNLYETAIHNTCGIMIILPLVIMYVFLQRYLVEGIERSGLTAE
jgi:ABC-type glycerol-3-phosphate transport system permease component